jgi:hypothetical protein
LVALQRLIAAAVAGGGEKGATHECRQSFHLRARVAWRVPMVALRGVLFATLFRGGTFVCAVAFDKGYRSGTDSRPAHAEDLETH